MSPPDTDLEQQKRRHWAPLAGMAAVLVFAGVLFVGWLFYEADEAAPPPEPNAETGVLEPAPGAAATE